MPARKDSQALTIADPEIEDLGPHMRALTPLQRRFVIGWISNKGKDAARVVRVAGYSQNNGVSRVQAHDLLRNRKILRAIQEEGGRRLDGLVALAVLSLEGNLKSSSPKQRQAAADSILDRTGYPRRTERSLEVDDKRPQRTYEQLLTAVAERLRVGTPVQGSPVEIEYKEIENVAQADATAQGTDEQPGDRAKAAPSSKVEDH